MHSIVPPVPLRGVRRLPVHVPAFREVLGSSRERSTTAVRELLHFGRRVLEVLTRHIPATPRAASEVRRRVLEVGRAVMRFYEVARVPPRERVAPYMVVITPRGPEYICPICGSVYFTESAIRAHMEAEHGVIVP